ncbi:hypothetical protein F5Y19DRAFT_475444 [Xylariaceae sp. FL1651]|nr:hypothetical protein F5Y19DRAFT_475444 [Xylariaceae sp. FL1651]
MEQDPAFEVIGIDSVKSLSLEELKSRVRDAGLSRSQSFDIFMGWLNEQIKEDIITQQEHLLVDFVQLLIHNHTATEPFSLKQVNKAFRGWLRKDAIENPTYRRRYLITQQDVHRLFAKEQERSQPSSTLSLSRRQRRNQEGSSAARSYEQGKKHAGSKVMVANRLQSREHDKTFNDTQRLAATSKPEVREIDDDDDDEFDYYNSPLTTTDAVSSQQPKVAPSQDTNRVQVPITRETSLLDSSLGTKMSHKYDLIRVDAATRKSCHVSKRKSHIDGPDLSAAPPKNYICKRCRKPGHWIQLCPTNLDPRYDQAPDRDYRCNFCGWRGDHFATLCPKNPHEVSLTKQRERAMHGPEITLDPAARTIAVSIGVELMSIDRITVLELEMKTTSIGLCKMTISRCHYIKREFPLLESLAEAWKEQREEVFHLDHMVLILSTMCIDLELLRFHIGLALGPVRKDNIGTETLTKWREDPTKYADETLISQEEAAKDAFPFVTTLPEDLNNISDEVDGFLHALAVEIISGDEIVPRLTTANTYDVAMGPSDESATDMCISDNETLDAAAGPEPSALLMVPSPQYRPVQLQQFSPEIVSLFKSRENPIIHSRANRRTACQMMERSDDLRTGRTQTDRLTDFHPPLVRRLSSDVARNNVGVD